MWNINEEIKSAINALQIRVDEIKISKAEEIVKNVTLKYAKRKYGAYLWEKLGEFAHINHKDSWQWASDLIGETEAIMFFNPSDEKSAFLFYNGKDVVSVLNETYGFEFYLTDTRMEYLVCFNHHDQFIACGSAKEWLQKYAVSKGFRVTK